MEDIPKLYTALAEWLSCLIFVLLLKGRRPRAVQVPVLAAALAVLMVLQYHIGIWPLAFWVPGMFAAFLIMYALILGLCRVTPADAAFYWALGFMFAEFTAALEWQMYSFVSASGFTALWLRLLFLLVFYGAIFLFLYRTEKKRLANGQYLDLTKREAFSTVVIALGAFLISNISYITPNTPLSGRMSTEIFYIRTLVDFAGCILLLMQQERWRELQLRQERDSISVVLQMQYEQYQQSRQNIDLINRKYHDLKHQIGIIKLETDSQKREEYLMQLEAGIRGYDANVKTGNAVLDTILTGKKMYCAEHNISMNVVADGEKLGYLDAMDICSIFGNALDNAIESAERLSDPEKRLIRVAVFTQNRFIIIRVENYYETPINIRNGDFVSTKQDKSFHGYGVRSIRYTAEKYGGTLSVTTDGNWFRLKVLLPLKSE